MPAKKKKKVCFFLTPIGEPNSPERGRADRIQKYILNEVLAAKFKVVRADELPQPGSITHQIIKLLFDADLIIADLTGGNANVVYELAIRHAFNKISVHLIDKAQKIPFDLKDERTIVFDLQDPASNDECKKELAKIIKIMSQRKFEYSSPVFRVLGVAAAAEEDKEEFLETMAGQIESIANDVSFIESNISSIETDVSLLDKKENELEDIDKTTQIICKDLYDVKLDVQKILERLRTS
jgi:hypothetical protein